MDPTWSGMVSTGGRELYAEIFGSGPVTMVIEVGSTMPGTGDPGWQPVRDALAQQYRVLLYDRANLGRSSPVNLPRALAGFSADLHNVLQGSGTGPPYLLIGGSLGGMIVLDFASQYPDEVRGVIVVDPPHPEINARTLAVLPQYTLGEPPALTGFRRLAWEEQFSPQTAAESEGMDYQDSIIRAKTTWQLGSIPLMVLTAGIDNWEEGFPENPARAYAAVWLEAQKEIAALSTKSLHILVNDSDHLIHCARPDAVLAAVDWIMTTRPIHLPRSVRVSGNP